MQLGPIWRAMMRNKTGAILIALQMAVTLAIMVNAISIIQERKTAMERPSPVPEPVTSAIRPSRSFMAVPSYARVVRAFVMLAKIASMSARRTTHFRSDDGLPISAINPVLATCFTERPSPSSS